MSVKWTCDFPECKEASEGHAGWTLEWESIYRTLRWIECIIRHYCPEHSKFLAGK